MSIPAVLEATVQYLPDLRANYDLYTAPRLLPFTVRTPVSESLLVSPSYPASPKTISTRLCETLRLCPSEPPQSRAAGLHPPLTATELHMPQTLSLPLSFLLRLTELPHVCATPSSPVHLLILAPA